ncbi:hypothetical protein A3754_06505 [Alcanivorax sp. HI0083]|nr:hypothetical protein A3730_17705 [Alcanivorax sp. HI0044]KZZ28226.1 hypothetical protein A3754_06505 [Alcanivorax sp. HI0083]
MVDRGGIAGSNAVILQGVSNHRFGFLPCINDILDGQRAIVRVAPRCQEQQAGDQGENSVRHRVDSSRLGAVVPRQG